MRFAAASVRESKKADFDELFGDSSSSDDGKRPTADSDHSDRADR